MDENRYLDYLDSGGFDPWEKLGRCGGYNSAVDQQALDVLRCIRRPNTMFCNDIAERLGMTPEHVELFQYLFCSADWCEYGSSPRGCFPMDDAAFEKLIGDWEAYYRAAWGEEPEPLPPSAHHRPEDKPD